MSIIEFEALSLVKEFEMPQWIAVRVLNDANGDPGLARELLRGVVKPHD